MKRVVLPALLAASAAASAAVDPGAATAPRTEFKAPAPGSYQLQVIQPAGNAMLLDATGRARPLSLFTHGKVTLLTFFYTNCADPLGCPFAYVTLSQLRSRVLGLRELASKVRFVSVSLDPENDTPAVIRDYAANFGTDPRFEWQFLTSDSVGRLLPLLDDFGQDVSVETDAGAARRVMHHMLKVFLIDERARVREIYSLAFLQPDVIFNDIRTLAMEQSRNQAARGSCSPSCARPDLASSTRTTLD